MKKIVINSQKGGSGKTSLCRVLSVQAVKNPPLSSVFLIDLDSQGSLTKWHEAREAEEPRRVDCPVEILVAGLGELEKSGADYVFIDTPPQASEHLDPVFMVADLVVIPIKPSPDDLQAAAVTVNRLNALGVPFLFVVNQAIQNSNITAQAIAALSHHGVVAETLCDALNLSFTQELLLAIWYHDAVYFPTRKDNEHMSSKLFTSIAEATYSYVYIDDVCNLIELTASHTQALVDLNQYSQVIMDADIMGLADDYNVYHAKTKCIRLENFHLPEDTFWSARADFLKHMLSKPKLFYTDYAFQTCEAKARHNLSLELKSIE